MFLLKKDPKTFVCKDFALKGSVLKQDPWSFNAKTLRV